MCNVSLKLCILQLEHGIVMYHNVQDDCTLKIPQTDVSCKRTRYVIGFELAAIQRFC